MALSQDSRPAVPTIATVSKSQPSCNENVTNDKYLKGCDAYFYIYYPDLYVFGFYFMFYGDSLGLFPATHKNPTRAPGVLLHYKHTRSLQLLNFNACCNYCLHFALMPGVME